VKHPALQQVLLSFKSFAFDPVDCVHCPFATASPRTITGSALPVLNDTGEDDVDLLAGLRDVEFNRDSRFSTGMSGSSSIWSM
jgi:hypothetical protein